MIGYLFALTFWVLVGWTIRAFIRSTNRIDERLGR
jgi:hypothetical protein